MAVIHKKVWQEYVEEKILKELAASQKEITDGKGKVLKSLKDLR